MTWPYFRVSPSTSDGTGATGTSVRHDAASSTVDYVGSAEAGAADSDPVWTITRLTITSGGDVTTATAIDAWDNRLTATYA